MHATDHRRMLSRSPRLAPLMLATMAAPSLLVVLSPTMVDVGREFGASVGAVGANALAWLVAGPVGGVLTDTVSWRAAHAVPAALALGALAAARRVTPVPAVAAPGPRTPWLGVLANRQVRRWLVAELAAWFVWAAELTYGGAFLTERHSVSQSAVGALFAVAAAAFFVGSVRSAPVQGPAAGGPSTVIGRRARRRIRPATAPAAGAAR